MRADDRALRRAVATLSTTLIIAWGSVYYAYALTAPMIAQETSWSKPFIYSGFSLTLLVAGLVSPWVGRAIDQHGGRPVMALGSIASAAGLAALGAMRGETTFLLACALCGVGMAMTFYDAGFATLTWLSAERARRAITLVTLAGGLASTVFWPLTQALLTFVDWRKVYLAYAALQAGFCAPLLALALPRRRMPPPEPAPAAAARAAPGAPLTGAARWRAFGLFASVLVTQGFVTNGLAVHLLPALTALGADPQTALLVGSLIGPSQVLGRVAELFFGRLIGPTTLGIVAVSLTPLAFALLLALPLSLPTLVAFALMYGLGNGLMTIARGLIPLTLFGRNGYGAMLGLLAAPVLVSQAAAPTFLAYVLSTHGSRALMTLCAGIVLIACLAMTVLAWRFGPRAFR